MQRQDVPGSEARGSGGLRGDRQRVPRCVSLATSATISAASSAKPSTRMASTYTALHMAGVGFPVDDE
ncbi:hypothetical protein OPV22_028347 [Ensete ventricosum]|uniref:Uncharacterized protein n=1 Tax=Ensete ventricosum TaxID=4639 RepID=A0AAV8PUG6_ENSVE|nr:hypothetical protein OPV22_028347 [Ensete ventricosum]